MTRTGYGFPIGTNLHRHGPWITDGIWAAHANLPFFHTLHDWLPNKDGVYRITGGIGGAYTYRRNSGGREMIRGLLAAPRWPARIVERAPHNSRNLDDVAAVMANDEPWYIEDPADRTKVVRFDGRIAATVELVVTDRDTITAWSMVRYARGEWALVGLVDDDPRFFLSQVHVGP